MRRLAFIVALTLAAHTAQAGAVLDEIHRRGTLRVGTTADYKPFTFRTGNTYSGADIDMARRLAQSLGVTLDLVPTVWASMMDDFVANKFDIAMGGITILPPRQAAGLFSDVTYVDGKRPVARCADQDRFTSIETIDQPGVRVIVNPGAANEQFAHANFHRATITVHRDNATVFDEIVAGHADVMVTDGIEADHQHFVHPELCATHVAAPFTRLEKAYWLQKDPAFQAAVDTWLAEEKKAGSWDRTLEAAQRAP